MQIRPFRRLAIATATATLLLTGAGALVRATGSGLGCLDEWPKCAGGWFAPLEYHALIEYSHRAIAGVVVVLLVGLVIAARRWMREDKSVLAWSVAGLVVVVFQALLGRVVVTSGLHAALVTAHYLTALALVGITVRIALVSRRGEAVPISDLALGALIGLIPLLVVGAYVREKGAGLAFGDWPLMGGRVFPEFTSSLQAIHFTHRALALVMFVFLVVATMRLRKDARSEVRIASYLGLGLFASQVGLGAANVLTRLGPWAVLAHTWTGFGIWASYVALAVVSRRGRTDTVTGIESVPAASGIKDRALAYVALTKPRIIILLLVTTVPAMVLAAGGLPSLWLVLATLTGGMLTAGSANALNQYLERDIDEKMKRTSARPLPSHSVGPTSALVFAIAVGIVGFAWLTLTVNLLSALLATSAIAFYVLIYTLLLKRSTPQNIVIGGAAGAVPVLVGWAAVTGTVEAPAWVMFAIIFFWTPPHFWALALRYRDDYERAGVPMLPVVKGTASTSFQVLAYAAVLVVVTLLMSPVGGLGALYAVAATALGLGFIYRAIRLRLDPTGATAMKLFRYSTSYLALLFVAMAVDRLVW